MNYKMIIMIKEIPDKERDIVTAIIMSKMNDVVNTSTYGGDLNVTDTITSDLTYESSSVIYLINEGISPLDILCELENPTTCMKCIYRCGRECRVLPPSVYHEGIDSSYYPVVIDTGKGIVVVSLINNDTTIVDPCSLFKHMEKSYVKDSSFRTNYCETCSHYLNEFCFYGPPSSYIDGCWITEHVMVSNMKACSKYKNKGDIK
jgi:hypothetical protein